jgi:hypothetical protein
VCQPPEYSSRKACDEEARFDVVFNVDAGAELHKNLLSWLTARPGESEHPGAEINHFQEQQRLRKQPFHM